MECGRCTEHCPAYNTGKVLNPKEIILGLRGLSERIRARQRRAAAGQAYFAKKRRSSAPPAALRIPVPGGHPASADDHRLRRGAVNTGKWEDDYGTKLFLTLERNGNSLGFAASERQKFIEKNGLPIYDGTQEYCLWLGCMGAYDPQGREIVLSLVARAAPSGRDVRRAAQGEMHGRSGAPAGQRSGVPAAGGDQHRNAASGQRQARWSPSARTACARSGRIGGNSGATFEIEHHSELLARLQERLPPRGGAARETVVFHDPCYLGRYRGIYDEPREVIAQTGDSGGTRRARASGRSAAARAAGRCSSGEEKGKRVNVERAEELVATGAQVSARPARSARRCSATRWAR